MKKVFLLLLTICLSVTTAHAIGQWKCYLAYYDVTEIEKAANTFYVLASNNLYSYNQNDQSIQTFDKTNGLNDTQISHIKWCQAAKRLVIVYSNHNIDLLDNSGNTYNISSYYSKSMTEDKTVNSIDIDGKFAYLSTAFGLLNLNVADANISNTYNLGFNVAYSYVENGYLYAASPKEGLYRASLTSNMLDKSNWSRVGDYQKRANVVDADLMSLVSTLNPGGPKYDNFGSIQYLNNRLYTCNGNWSQSSGIQIFDLENKEWVNYQNEGIKETTGVSYPGAYCLTVDPDDANHIFSGNRNGIYEFLNGKFIKYYDKKDSPIEPFDGKSIEYQLVSGITYDKNGDLWILNSQAPTASLIKMSNGEFTQHNHQELMKLNDDATPNYKNKSNGNLTNMWFDSKGYLWFVNNHGWYPAFYRYNTATDELLTFKDFVNQDGTTFTIGGDGGVRCVAEDLNGNIWAATSAGPLLLEKSQIESSNPVYTQVKIPRNDGTNYADYLLNGTDLSCMAIDGGNRKWFGSNENGVYLISADNMEQISHFTTENSPLLSNTILSIAINPNTGEVFFGTEKGLCSYMSDATKSNENMTKDNVYAYPNPVKPDYTGVITVVGLSYNAEVKITTTNGRLVAEGRSNGGIFTWDGCDQSGKRVASGIYMVNASTEDGKKGTVCKIAIVR